MKVIVSPRMTGKTTNLIKMAHADGGIIVTFSREEAHRLHRISQDLKQPIHLPITWHEFLQGQYYAPGCRRALIDNLDLCLQSISKIPIDVVTFSMEFSND